MAQPGRHRRKLLIASIGVAAVSYVSCGGDDATPSTDDAGVDAGATGGSGGSGGSGGVAVSDAADTKDRTFIVLDAIVANLLPPQQ